MEKGTAYVVRGAQIKCDKGSQTIRINLPVSHGSYSNGQPIMIESDNVVGQNISKFGNCSGDCPDCGSGREHGRRREKMCQIKILKEWMNTKEDTLIDGKPALTTDSVLICAYGGKISFITDGQS